MGNNQAKPITLKEKDLKFLKKTNKKMIKKKLIKLRMRLQGFHRPYRIVWKQHIRDEDIGLLHYTAAVGSVEALELVIYYGDNMNITTASGFTPFHMAVHFKQYEKLKLLTDVCDIDLQEKSFHYTPLHWACKNNDYVAVKKLLDLNATDTIEDIHGFTASHIVRKNKNSTGILKLFTAHQTKDSNHNVLENFQRLSRQVSELSDKISLCSRPRSQVGSLYSSRRSSRTNSLSTLNYESGIETIDENSSLGYSTYNRGRPFNYQYPEAQRIQIHFCTILEHIHSHSINEIINKLFSKLHISQRFKEHLKHQKGDAKTEELLQFIMKKTQITFDAFVLALRETGNEALANLLDPQALTESHQETSLYSEATIYDNVKTRPLTPRIRTSPYWNPNGASRRSMLC